MANGQKQRLNSQDHDLLIRLDENVRGMRQDIKELGDRTTRDFSESRERIGSIETRISQQEHMSLQYPPAQLSAQVTAFIGEWKEFSITRRVELQARTEEQNRLSAEADRKEKRRIAITGGIATVGGAILSLFAQAVIR